MSLVFREPPLIEVTYTYRCCVASCDSVYSLTSLAYLGSMLAPPATPDGWMESFRGAIFCPRHKLGTIVDGEIIPA